MENQFFTVGELSEMTGVSKQTIRYYDKIGLLKPGKIADNAYRYYEPIHILYLNTIMRLSQLGCSLKEVKQFLSGGDIKSVNNMLQFRKIKTEQKVKELNYSLKALEHQIDMIEIGMNAPPAYNVEIKQLPERYFSYEAGFDEINVKKAIMQINVLVKELDHRGLLFVGNPVFELTNNQHLLRTGFFIIDKVDLPGINFETIPAGEYACLYHKGKYDEIYLTINRLKKYLKSNGLTAKTNIFQLFLIDFALTRNEEELITEIQVRIK